VRKKGLEPPRDFSHSHLKAACIPVSPLPHIIFNIRYFIITITFDQIIPGGLKQI
jgi:hypothetical protein